MNTNTSKGLEAGMRVRLHSGKDTGTIERVVPNTNGESYRMLVRWDSGSYGSWHVNELVPIATPHLAVTLDFEDDSTAVAVAAWLLDWCCYPNDASANRPQDVRLSNVIQDIISSLPKGFEPERVEALESRFQRAARR